MVRSYMSPAPMSSIGPSSSQKHAAGPLRGDNAAFDVVLDISRLYDVPGLWEGGGGGSLDK